MSGTDQPEEETFSDARQDEMPVDVNQEQEEESPEALQVNFISYQLERQMQLLESGLSSRMEAMQRDFQIKMDAVLSSINAKIVNDHSSPYTSHTATSSSLPSGTQMIPTLTAEPVSSPVVQMLHEHNQPKGASSFCIKQNTLPPLVNYLPQSANYLPQSANGLPPSANANILRPFLNQFAANPGVPPKISSVKDSPLPVNYLVATSVPSHHNFEQNTQCFGSTANLDKNFNLSADKKHTSSAQLMQPHNPLPHIGTAIDARRRLHDLPAFGGKAEEWPVFITTYQESTRAFGYSDLENTMRLQKSLYGEAKETVASLMIHPNNVSMLISQLEFRFGRPEQLIKSQILQVRKIPPIGENQLEELIPFAVKVKNLATFLEAANGVQHMCNPTLMDELVAKLPMTKRLEWAQYSLDKHPFATVTVFSNWIDGVARLVQIVSDSMPLESKSWGTAVSRRQGDQLSVKTGEAVRKPVVFLHASEVLPARLCPLCVTDHYLTDCIEFARLDIQNRWKLVKEKSLCFSCLKGGHNSFRCRQSKECAINQCRRKHNNLLHEDFESRPAVNNERQQRVLNFNRVTTRQKVLFRVVPVTVYGPKSQINTFAFLDEGSSATIMEKELAEGLGLNGRQEMFSVEWFGGRSATEKARIVDLEISGRGKFNRKFSLNNLYVIPDLQLPVQSLKLEELNSRYNYMKRLPIYDYAEARPQILIGLDNGHLGVSLSRNKFVTPGPIVSRTKLGWVVYGPVPDTDKLRLRNQMYLVHTPRTCENRQLQELQSLMEEYFDTDNLHMNNTTKILESKENERANAIMQSTTKRIGNHFEIGLLWKCDQPHLPSSQSVAINRLKGIERKMARDSEFARMYENKIDEYLQKGYARRLLPNEIQDESPNTWYLPHFGVKNPNKPGKLRLVFDAAAKSDGVSLNDALMSGPDINQPLVKILFKFREAPIGICGDIKEMFHQIQIRKEDQDSQRFLWRHGSPENPIEVYAMVAMTFGATCSPSLAQHIKNTNAREHEDQYPLAAKAIIEKHYVDDYVDCFLTAEAAIETVQQVVHVHREGGFELRNFVTNSKRLRRALDLIGQKKITENDDSNINVNMQDKNERVLGMYWRTHSDEFIFELKFHKIAKDILDLKRRPTKRELLSFVMSIFDPFGLLANFLIYTKLIMQEVYKSGIEWDEPIADETNQKWIQWYGQLYKVKQFRVARCHAFGFATGKNVQLHIFVDASESAYAVVAYWRIMTEENEIVVSFIAARTRCAPKKLTSIPRLELQAAVLGVRVKNFIIENHSVKVQSSIFWTDSTTVVSWVRSDHRSFKPFVAHRIAEILDSSGEDEWRWLPTELNVSDEATRAVYPIKYDSNGRWMKGPEFLHKDPEQWPKPPLGIATNECITEIRPKCLRMLHVNDSHYSMPQLKYFSNYSRLQRATAYVLRFYHNCRSTIRSEFRLRNGNLSAEELDNAEQFLCRNIQREAYSTEYVTLESKGKISRESSIFKLTPALNSAGVMVLKGRLDNAMSISVSSRRPIILPRKHYFTELLVNFYHRKFHHHNQELIICSIRTKFWIPHLRVLVKKIKSQCQTCKIRAAEPATPLMGQLPPDRVTPFVFPFSYTGVDYFGPVLITIGRRHEKRWVALFTCLTTRAVHLEVAADLTTDACILCIRNFMNRRGIPVRMRSDQGTNFVGIDGELRYVEDFVDNEKIKSKMASFGVEWVFNSPKDPSAGGAWERLVRSVKKVLSYTLKEVAPRQETLYSLLLEAENIVNSRPLTHVPVESEEDEPLTPNHFLLGRMNSTQTPAPFDKKLMCLRKQWRIAQQLKNQFWKRWIAEYLPELTRRSKWYEKTEPIKVGDLVIICDSDCARSQWCRGRIENVFSGKDGVVRAADVKTSTGVLRRPVHKLAVLDVGSAPMFGESPDSIHGGENVAVRQKDLKPDNGTRSDATLGTAENKNLNQVG